MISELILQVYRKPSLQLVVIILKRLLNRSFLWIMEICFLLNMQLCICMILFIYNCFVHNGICMHAILQRTVYEGCEASEGLLEGLRPQDNYACKTFITWDVEIADELHSLAWKLNLIPYIRFKKRKKNASTIYWKLHQWLQDAKFSNPDGSLYSSYLVWSF